MGQRLTGTNYFTYFPDEGELFEAQTIVKLRMVDFCEDNLVQIGFAFVSVSEHKRSLKLTYVIHCQPIARRYIVSNFLQHEWGFLLWVL